MTAYSPDFISVTYGASGKGNSAMTAQIAASIEQHGVHSLAHLTCIGAKRETMLETLDEMKRKGIRNVLALRGDIPEGFQMGECYRYAEDLIRELRDAGGFCIGAACYPEGHIECGDIDFDTGCLRRKQDAGADFFITQLFFDNDYFYRFLERVRGAGITLPISAGVMPILGRKQIERMIFMCGASLPSGIIKLLHKYENEPEDLRKAGIEYAAKQAESLLANGAQGIHFYTMNKPEIAEYCMKHIGRI
jgi:methylenetetrahydrofolate reductase (NADPH)